jgi:hypothetical protein
LTHSISKGKEGERKGEREEGEREGGKEGKKEGRKEGRKEGKKEEKPLSCFGHVFQGNPTRRIVLLFPGTLCCA